MPRDSQGIFRKNQAPSDLPKYPLHYSIFQTIVNAFSETPVSLGLPVSLKSQVLFQFSENAICEIPRRGGEFPFFLLLDNLDSQFIPRGGNPIAVWRHDNTQNPFNKVFVQ